MASQVFVVWRTVGRNGFGLYPDSDEFVFPVYYFFPPDELVLGALATWGRARCHTPLDRFFKSRLLRSNKSVGAEKGNRLWNRVVKSFPKNVDIV